MTDFLHGVEVNELDSGARPIRSIATGVIGLVGTARMGPVNRPTLVSGSRREARQKFGSSGTIPTALAGILDQAGAPVVVVNVIDRVAVSAAPAAFVGDTLQLGVPGTGRSVADVVIASAASVAAEKDVGAGDQAIEVMAAAAGVAGNAITVALVDPGANDRELAVAVAGTAISVSLATGNAGAITSTNTDVVAAINASAAAAALVIASIAAGGTAGTVVSAVGAVNLAGGAGRTYDVTDDYTVDADTGVVTRVATGAIAAGQAVTASYSYLGDGTAADVVGQEDDEAYAGVYALQQAESLGLPRPRILIAPGFSDDAAVAGALKSVADRLRAIAVIEGPNTTDAAAVTHREGLDSPRLYLVDPAVKAGSPAVVEPASARVAGVIARTDAERGFWWSPSNQVVTGVVGTARPVDFRLGDQSSRANHLNENEVATIIRQDGYRLWGNRTLSSDPKRQFLNVVRIADEINERILRSHLWAVDRNLTRTLPRRRRRGRQRVPARAGRARRHPRRPLLGRARAEHHRGDRGRQGHLLVRLHPREPGRAGHVPVDPDQRLPGGAGLMIIDILRNINLFVDGRGYAGQVDEVMLPNADRQDRGVPRRRHGPRPSRSTRAWRSSSPP